MAKSGLPETSRRMAGKFANGPNTRILASRARVAKILRKFETKREAYSSRNRCSVRPGGLQLPHDWRLAF